jgi:hypothetical protein
MKIFIATQTGKKMIRRTTRDDIAAIEELYFHTKNNVELNWLLPDTLDQNTFRSFVAVSDNRIVGHISYVMCKFKYNETEFSGVHPHAWIVSPEYRGSGAGSKLMHTVFDMGDFSYFIGGTKATQTVVPWMGFKLKFFVLEYVKSLESPCAADASSADKKPLSLEKYKQKDTVWIPASKGVFTNAQDSSHIGWVLDCPLCDTHAFSIKQDGKHPGLAVCYIGKSKDDILTGRIVHLSYLGDRLDPWQKALFEIEKFFMDKGCLVVAALASHPTFVNALIENGYTQRPKYPASIFNGCGRPFFLRDPQKNLQDIPDESFHLTFLEGDMGYRNF